MSTLIGDEQVSRIDAAPIPAAVMNFVIVGDSAAGEQDRQAMYVDFIPFGSGAGRPTAHVLLTLPNPATVIPLFHLGPKPFTRHCYPSQA